MTKIYLRPAAFVDAPFDLDGQVARLAGGLVFFSAVEIQIWDGRRRERLELIPVDALERRLSDLPDEAGEQWARLTAPRPALALGERIVRLDQPQVMGIVNVTPDSFSDGGEHLEAEAAIEAAHRMAASGAAIIDVGGESTRPGAKPVWEGDEIARIEPVVRRLAMAGTATSIDTRKSAVMDAAIRAGATLVNDVSALRWDDQSAHLVARAQCPIILMHHVGTPETMQEDPSYDRPVLFEVYDWLEERIAAAVDAGISRDRILVDPGFGFGKTVQHNLELMNGLSLLHGLGCPLVIGASRKRTIGALSGEAPADQRLGGSLAFAVKAAEQGVQVIRVHDVPETIQALRIWRGMRDAALIPSRF